MIVSSVAALMLVLPLLAAAHYIPNDVRAHAFADRLSQFPRPALDALQLAVAIRWLMLVLILAGLAWFARGALRRRTQRQQRQSSGERPDLSPRDRP